MHEKIEMESKKLIKNKNKLAIAEFQLSETIDDWS